MKLKTIIITLLLFMGSSFISAQQNNSSAVLFNNVGFEAAVSTPDTSNQTSLRGYNHVTYAFSIAGADSVRWKIDFDKKIHNTWVLNFATDSLSYGGTGATDTYPIAIGTLRVGATGETQEAELIRVRLTRSEVDSTSTTTYKLTLNLRE